MQIRSNIQALLYDLEEKNVVRVKKFTTVVWLREEKRK